MVLKLFRDYKYHNSPDGTEPLEKIIATSKYGFTAGLATGIYECGMNEAINGPLKAANCMAFHVIPLTAIAATFAATTYAATKIRGKDEPLNYAIGAMVSSSIIYKVLKRPMLAFGWGVAGALVTSAYKHARDIGMNVTPMQWTYVPAYQEFLGDYTFSKERRPWKN